MISTIVLAVLFLSAWLILIAFLFSLVSHHLVTVEVAHHAKEVFEKLRRIIADQGLPVLEENQPTGTIRIEAAYKFVDVILCHLWTKSILFQVREDKHLTKVRVTCVPDPFRFSILSNAPNCLTKDALDGILEA
ncbi:MAG: hypothetical protein V3R94_07220, partial [Acidobacteriota bacterium]